MVIKDQLPPVHRIQLPAYPEHWIEYCPLHASAPQMLEALKDLVIFTKSQGSITIDLGSQIYEEWRKLMAITQRKA
jgi:hypothetical protein